MQRPLRRAELNKLLSFCVVYNVNRLNLSVGIFFFFDRLRGGETKRSDLFVNAGIILKHFNSLLVAWVFDFCVMNHLKSHFQVILKLIFH